MTNKPTIKEKAKATNALVGKNIRLFRHERGLTQTQVGEYLGITHQQIQKYERGTNRTSVGILQNLADLFKVTVAEFFISINSMGINDFRRGDLETIRGLYTIKNEGSKKHLLSTVKLLVKLEKKGAE